MSDPDFVTLDHPTDDRFFPCPDCIAEGAPVTSYPINGFYTWVTGGHTRRSTICRRHFNKNRNTRLKAMITPGSPTYNAEVHTQVNAYKRSWQRRKITPGSPDYDPALHARQKAAWCKQATDRRTRVREAKAQGVQ